MRTSTHSYSAFHASLSSRSGTPTEGGRFHLLPDYLNGQNMMEGVQGKCDCDLSDTYDET